MAAADPTRPITNGSAGPAARRRQTVRPDPTESACAAIDADETALEILIG